MEQCEQLPPDSGCFNLEKISSDIHLTERCMNWRGDPKMVMKSLCQKLDASHSQ
jgi:hypothetical protein